jgi:cyclase
MSQTLIVARMDPDRAPAVADLFTESDNTALPYLVGVTRRTLFSFHDLYFHLIEAGEDLARNLYAARQNPLFVELNEKLSQHITPYSPAWREPRDAMATAFYSWQSDKAKVRG